MKFDGKAPKRHHVHEILNCNHERTMKNEWIKLAPSRESQQKYEFPFHAFPRINATFPSRHAAFSSRAVRDFNVWTNWKEPDWQTGTTPEIPDFYLIECDGRGEKAFQRPAGARRGGLSGLQRIGLIPLSMEANRAKLFRKNTLFRVWYFHPPTNYFTKYIKCQGGKQSCFSLFMSIREINFRDVFWRSDSAFLLSNKHIWTSSLSPKHLFIYEIHAGVITGWLSNEKKAKKNKTNKGVKH